MGTLLDLNPQPQGGEWYSVIFDGISGIRIVVLINKDLPGIATLSDQLHTTIGNCKDPVLLSAEEAEECLIQEVEDLELVSSLSDKQSFTAILARHVHVFKIKYFG